MVMTSGGAGAGLPGRVRGIAADGSGFWQFLRLPVLGRRLDRQALRRPDGLRVGGGADLGASYATLPAIASPTNTPPRLSRT